MIQSWGFFTSLLENLKRVKVVVGVAGGKEKTEAILGALRGEYIDVIITNEGVARKLIEIVDGVK